MRTIVDVYADILRKGMIDMNKLLNKLLCLFLSIVMACSMSVFGVFAQDENDSNVLDVNQGEVEQGKDSSGVLENSGLEENQPGSDDENEVSIVYVLTDLSVKIEGSTAVLAWKSDYEKGDSLTNVFDIYANDEKVALDDGNITRDENGVFKTSIAITQNKAYSFYVKAGDICSNTVRYVPNVKNLKGVRGYKRVLLKWDKVSGASNYIVKIYRNSSLYKTVTVSNNSYDAYTPDFSTDGKANSKYYSYKFYVYTKNGSATSASSSLSTSPVRPMLITAKAKSRKAITCGGKTKYVLKKGQKFVSAGFNGGRLKPYVNGKRCSFPLVYSKSNSGSYVSWDYSVATKEKFVNDKNVTSGTKYLVWVSQYTQRVNFFTKVNGRWKYYKSYRCSTGKASTPTCVGDYKVHKKMRSRHSIPYWTSFYSNMSIHTKPAGKSAKKLGIPKSGGCVRVEKSNALWVYKYVGKNTKVIVY